MKKCFVLLSICLFSFNVNAQWFSQNPILQGNDLYSVKFVDQNTGWAVGDGGIILKTTDGGINWVIQTSGISLRLFSVLFIDQNNGWAVGVSGIILHTTDGGTNWMIQTSRTSLTLYSVYFIDQNTGWIGGRGIILHTTDGGVNWTSQLDQSEMWTSSLYFFDENNGWAVAQYTTIPEHYESVILKTVDGGENWTIVKTEVDHLRSICFIDQNNGWIAMTYGDHIDFGAILKTTDGGLSWNWQTYGIWGGLESVYFIDQNTGWAVGEIGIIIKTTDGGTNWIAQTSGTNNYLYDIYFIDENTGWVVGEGGMILKTIDGGDGLPVELNSFSVSLVKDEVILNWSTATEVNNYGFEIERSQPSEDRYQSNQQWAKVGFVDGHGNSNSPKNYSFTDNNPGYGKIQYRLKQIDNDGKFEYSEIVDINIDLPLSFELNQNYPNPFNPTTKIGFQIPGGTSGLVSLKVYDILGREVATLVNEEKPAGFYEVEFSAKGGYSFGENALELSSGIYFYRLQAGNFIDTKKFTLMK